MTTRTKLLEREPPGPINSTAALLAIARGIEARAAARYRALAARMRDARRPELATLLDRLAREESRHAERLAAGSDGVPPTLLIPEGADAEEADPARLTPYRVLSLAVRSEERAFAFYSHVAAAAESPDVRALAETLAREELAHAALLRRERRAAFRAEGLAGRPPPEPGAGSLAELWARAAAVEAEAAARHRVVAEALLQAGDGGATRVRAIAEEEAQAARDCAERIGGVPPDPGLPLAPADPRQPIAEAIALYRDIADRAADPTVAAEAERLAAAAAARLQRLERP
jgi:rubrerythrin